MNSRQTHDWNNCKRQSALCHLLKPWHAPVRAKLAISISFPHPSTPLTLDTKNMLFAIMWKSDHFGSYAVLQLHTTCTYMGQTLLLLLHLNVSLRLHPARIDSTVLQLVNYIVGDKISRDTSAYHNTVWESCYRMTWIHA